jgi:hypothetical protein
MIFSVHAVTGSDLSVIIRGYILLMDFSSHFQVRHLLMCVLLLDSSILHCERLITP